MREMIRESSEMRSITMLRSSDGCYPHDSESVVDMTLLKPFRSTSRTER